MREFILFWLFLITKQSKLQYYKRFTGNQFPNYERSYGPSEFWPISCNTGTTWNYGCGTDLKTYEGWTISTGAFSDSLINSCGVYRMLGGYGLFGEWNFVQKTFNNLPWHYQVIFELTIWKIDSWDNEGFQIKINGNQVLYTTYYWEGSDICGLGAGYNEQTYSYIFTINDSGNSISISFQSFLDQDKYDESWGIQNFKVYLLNSCLSSCLTCDLTNTNICKSCPNLAKLISGSCICMNHYYMETGDYTHCHECHINCKTCFGAANTQCVTCYADHLLSGGVCVPNTNIIKNPVEFNGIFTTADVTSSWTITGQKNLIICTECGENIIVGGYNNFDGSTKMKKTYNLNLPHYKIGYHFDFYKIDSWDTEHFYVYIDGIKRTDIIYTNDVDNEFVNNYIGNNYNDKIEDLYVLVEHSQATLAIEISTSLDSLASDESWGVGNYQLITYLCHPTCLTCSSELSTNCITCYTNAQLNGLNECLCKDYYYRLSFANPCVIYPCSTCSPCHSTCLSCSNSLSTSCTKCSSDRYLLNGECKLCSEFNCATCTSSTICQSCVLPYVLVINKCEIYCPFGQFKDTTNSCQPCHNTCLTCNGPSDKNCETCTSQKYLSSENSCIPCLSPCATCYESNTKCSSCIINYALSGTTCISLVDGCPAGEWLRASDNTCQKCDSICIKCVNGSPKGCTECKDIHSFLILGAGCYPCDTCNRCNEDANKCIDCVLGSDRFLFGTTCIKICPNGYYPNTGNNKCESCDSSCLTCDGPTNNNCKSCIESKVLISGVCESCDINCKECVQSKTKCTKCESPLFLNLITNICDSSCSINQFEDLDTRTCRDCDNTCLTCNGGTYKDCLSCKDKSYRYSTRCLPCDNTCTTCVDAKENCLSCSLPLYLLNNKCTPDKCPAGLYNNDNTAKCEKCDSNCLNCENNANECISCLTKYFVSNIKTCLPCDSTCQTCSISANNCLTCELPLYFKENSCLTECGNGFYGSIIDGLCHNCDSSCLTCSGPLQSNCKTCIDGKVLNTLGYCVDCHPTCLLCSSISNYSCKTCKFPLYFSDGYCLQECENGYYTINNPIKECKKCDKSCKTCIGSKKENCLTCDSGIFFNLLDNSLRTGTCNLICPFPLFSDIGTNKCVDHCSKGFYAEIKTNICKLCDQKCLSCLGPSQNDCIECYPNFFLYNSNCNSSCPNGYYPDPQNKICDKCLTNCSICSNKTICDKCNSNFYSINSNTLCTDCKLKGWFPNIQNNKCDICPEFCLNCSSVDLCYECNNNYTFLHSGMCLNYKYVKPEIISSTLIPNLYFLNFNSSFPNFFTNISKNSTFYPIINITDIVDSSNYEYKIKSSIILENSFEIQLKLNVLATNASFLQIFLNPDEEDSIKLTQKFLTMPITPVSKMCSIVQNFNLKTQMCEDLLIVVPSLLKTTDPSILILQFNENFEDLFQILNNVSNITIENTLSSFFKYEIKETNSSLQYQIDLKFQDSLLGKHKLFFNFDLPFTIQYHPKKKLVPESLQIELLDYYIYEDEFLKSSEGVTKYLFGLLAAIHTLVTYSSLGYTGMMSVLLIRYLRYIDIGYPPNALRTFIYNLGGYSLFPVIRIDDQDLNFPQPSRKLEFYKIKAYVLENGGSKILEIFAFFLAGLILKHFYYRYLKIYNSKPKGKEKNKIKLILLVINLLYFIGFMIIFFFNFVDISFYCFVNISWLYSNSKDGILNLSLSSLILLLDLIFFVYCFEILMKLNKIFKDIRVHIKKDIPFNDDSINVNNISNSIFPESFSLNRSRFDGPYNSERLKNVSIAKRKTWWQSQNNIDLTKSKGFKHLSKAESKILSMRTFNEEKGDYEWRKLYLPYYPFVILFYDFKKRRRRQILYGLIDIIRCFIIVGFIVLFQSYFYLLASLILGINTMFFVYLIWSQPFKKFKLYIIQLIIEICVWIATLMAYLIAKDENNNIFDKENRMLMGYFIYYSNLIAIYSLIFFYLIDTVFSLSALLIKKCG